MHCKPIERTPWTQTTFPQFARHQLRAVQSNLPTAPRSPRSDSRRRSMCLPSVSSCAIRSLRSPTARTPSPRWSRKPINSAAIASLHSTPKAGARQCRRSMANGSAARSWQRRPSDRSTPHRHAMTCHRRQRSYRWARPNSGAMPQTRRSSPTSTPKLSVPHLSHDSKHRVQIPRRHVARGLHRVDVPACDRHQQPVGGAVDGRRG